LNIIFTPLSGLAVNNTVAEGRAVATGVVKSTAQMIDETVPPVIHAILTPIHALLTPIHALPTPIRALLTPIHALLGGSRE